jgi:carbon monoxide dehydrogenase subunit G
LKIIFFSNRFSLPYLGYYPSIAFASSSAVRHIKNVMQLTGKHVIHATPSMIWKMLMDTDTLTSIVPGVTRLEKTGDHSFKSILEIKMGPVSGSFTGDLHMEDVREEKGFTLRVKQHSKIGNADAAIKIDLLPVNDDQTEISFDGNVRMTGVLGHMGHRVMGGVSHTLTNQFFSNFEAALKKEQAT